MNILIVDDEVSFRTQLGRLFTDQSMKLFYANDGVAGLNLLATEKIDIVISNLYMHVMDGIKFLRTARELPGYESIPFLFVSSYVDENTLSLLNTLENAGLFRKGHPYNELVTLFYHLAPKEEGGGLRKTTLKAPRKEAAASNTTSKPTDKKSPVHILVVDDEDSLRLLLTDMLTAEGYKVSTAADGSEAIKMLEQEKFDLVLLDIVMPNVSGFGVLRHIKENVPNTKVIMVTAYSELKLAVESKMHGAQDFVAKPFMRADLLSTIRKVLKS